MSKGLNHSKEKQVSIIRNFPKSLDLKIKKQKKTEAYTLGKYFEGRATGLLMIQTKTLDPVGTWKKQNWLNNQPYIFLSSLEIPVHFFVLVKLWIS